MNIDGFLLALQVAVEIALIILLVKKLFFDKILELKNKQSDQNEKLMNLEKSKMYASIDTKAVNEELEKWIKKYLDDYILKNITIPKVEYIKKAEVDQMLKETSANLILDMSDLYRWYISLLVNSTNEDNIIDFINKKLIMYIVAFVSDHNQAK